MPETPVAPTDPTAGGPAALADALAAVGLPADTRAERVTAGYASTLWRVHLPGGEQRALRLLAPYAEVATELATMAAARERGVPAPEVVARGVHDGHDVLLLTWCAGEQLAETLLAGGDLPTLGHAFGRAQARLHRPGPDGRVVCHGDYHPQNVLVEHGEVSGVVDWSDAYFGDARADLATTWVTLELVPALVPAWDPAFTVAWQEGYGDFPTDRELAPWLADRAARQRDIWLRRVAAGEAAATVGEAARAIADRH